MIVTAAEREAIRAAREAGKSWVQVGLSVHRCIADIRAYGQNEMGLPAYLPGKEPRPRLDEPVDDNRQPLEAGNAATWGAIAAKTLLAGIDFRADGGEGVP